MLLPHQESCLQNMYRNTGCTKHYASYLKDESCCKTQTIGLNEQYSRSHLQF